ncbi:MAG: hypothetical protein JXQ29_10630 [Planctomycetes bacterium]|nr:hypothetical protein [Planctomycetota bacterium]
MSPRRRRSLQRQPLLAAFALLALAALAPAQPPSGPAGRADDEDALFRGIEVTRWDDPHTRPDTYAEYLAARARHALDAPFAAEVVYVSPPGIYAGTQRIDMLVASPLETALEPELTQYAQDLEAEGWGVVIWKCTGGTPPEVRAFLQGRRAEAQILGSMMIGDLPVAWYEMDDDFNNTHSEFPSDLYYMDLDGTFGDGDQDGKFDSHDVSPTGDQRPEIFLGRLRASPLAGTWGTEVELLRNYFAKVHAYRAGTLSAPRQALAFQDDDWYTMATEQAKAYATVVTVSDKYETTAANYQARLLESYHSVVVCAHSSPSGHSFKVPASSGGSLSNTALWALDPPGLFYNLFACSNARYTSTRYMGGVYIFVKSTGLIAVGTTKTGSMLSFGDYYASLGRHDTFGEAFRSWFARRWPYSLTARRWFYGMTLLGDPTLRIRQASLAADYTSAGPGQGFTVDFALDGRPDRAGDPYVILASQTGTSPGFPVPATRVPLVFDTVTWFFLFALNGPAFPNSCATLDAAGQARARLRHAGPIPPALLGHELHFSALLSDARTLGFRAATPPATVKLVE